MDDFVRLIPKAELHLHIEGTLEPELALKLASKHGITLKHGSTVQDLKRAYHFHDLQSFLDIYYAVAAVLKDEDDFYLLAHEYLLKAHADGVVRAEIFFDPQTHEENHVPFATVINGLHKALEEARKTMGMSCSLIMCFLRHLTEDAAFATLERALQFKHLIEGVGLDSGESGNPPSKFKNVFKRAKQEGWKIVAHAGTQKKVKSPNFVGEEGPPGYIYEALDVLGAQRIDHGVRSIEDPVLCKRLVAEHTPLTVCPLSNIKLCVFKKPEDHNLKKLLDMGLNVCINADDPAYFGGYIVDNYMAMCHALNLSKKDVVTLAINSIRSTFLPKEEKEAFVRKISDYAKHHGVHY